ncbi:MAG: DUF5130 domain-containing protein [Rhodococcus sp. (in: high G+C Gram-positive bacteria)]|uniref:DUF5130 domain-containing protein n=1 Tax=Rhodococcus TaxID=1827 RepID=UPI0013293219|nr:DUF5130 domain-containing protein [Rhodococcus sp. RDE2]MCR8691882.1 DUF5130 domain-containing protein [Rhodococcus pyridinivorans]MXQ77529.1 DUF5130 family protein [Rhodococcus rhodochrous]BDB60029.1 hypothetical protein RDE2_18230 [Rhodococcus sp. RDE2]
MASGDVIQRPAVAPENLPHGAALTASGRISAVRGLGQAFTGAPFKDRDLITLDDTLTHAIRITNVRFTVYIGDDVNPAAATDALLPTTPDADNSVLVAVFPNQRSIEVRSGRTAADRATDRVLQLGITAAVSSFGQGNLLDGITSAVRVIANAMVAP